MLCVGSPEATRRAFNKRFLLDLAADWQQHGREVFKRVRRESPASYLKVCAMLVPREMKVEHRGGVKGMTEEQIVDAIEAIQGWLEARAGEAAKVIEGTAEPAALPAPNELSPEVPLEATLAPAKRTLSINCIASCCNNIVELLEAATRHTCARY